MDFNGGGLVDVLFGEELEIFIVQIRGSIDLAGKSAAMTDERTVSGDKAVFSISRTVSNNYRN